MSDDFFTIVGSEEKPVVFVCKRYIQLKDEAGFGKHCNMIAASNRDFGGKTHDMKCKICDHWVVMCDCKEGFPFCTNEDDCRHLKK